MFIWNSLAFSMIQRMMASAYLKLLIFLLGILIPACVSSSPVFLMMYSSCKLNKQGDNIQPWCNPFPIWNQSVFPCPFLRASSRHFRKCTVSMHLLPWRQSHLPLSSWWVRPPPFSPHLCPSSRSARKKKQTNEMKIMQNNFSKS